MNARPWHLPALLVAAGLLFGLGIGRYDLWPADEPRFGEVAREMVASGDYLVPRVNGHTYTEKPPLMFWSIALASIPFGEVNEIAARLPSVAGALIAIALAYAFARRAFGAHAALWTAIALATCYQFWTNARNAQIDMVLTACTTASFYALWRWDESREKRWLFMLWGAAALGMLAKGPPALVFPLLCIVAFYWREPYARKSTRWILGALAACAIAALWLVPARMAGHETAEQAVQSGIAGNLFRNTIGRFFIGVNHIEAPWYFLYMIPLGLAPWCLFLPWSLPWIMRMRKENRAARYLVAWIAPAFVFFSISLGKRDVYVLPLYPALAVLIGASLAALLEAERPLWEKWFTRLWAGFSLLLPVACVFGYISLRKGVYAGAANSLLPAAAVALAIAVTSSALLFAKHRWILPHAIAAQMAALLLVLGNVVYPGINPMRGASDFCAPIRALADAKQDFRLYSLGFTREQFIYYAHKFHKPCFVDLIPMPGMEQVDPYEFAALQIKARKLIVKSVEDVPIADPAQPTSAEIDALRKAMDEGVASTGDKAPLVRAFEDTLRRELDKFSAEFTQPTPAFFFVEDEDWRWMLPLHSAPPQYALIKHEPVGSRYVLLFANQAGAELIAKR